MKQSVTVKHTLSKQAYFVYGHAANSTHSIDYEGVVVKAREEDWFKRGVKEAIHIKRKASDLNKDKGRHQLPSVYDSYYFILPINNFRSDDPVSRQFHHQHQSALKIGGCRSQATNVQK